MECHSNVTCHPYVIVNVSRVNVSPLCYLNNSKLVPEKTFWGNVILRNWLALDLIRVEVYTAEKSRNNISIWKNISFKRNRVNKANKANVCLRFVLKLRNRNLGLCSKVENVVKMADILQDCWLWATLSETDGLVRREKLHICFKNPGLCSFIDKHVQLLDSFLAVFIQKCT